MSRLEQFEESRKQHFSNLSDNNVQLYPYLFNRTHLAEDIHQKYSSLSNDSYSNDSVAIAGRVMLVRNLGKIIFIDIHDLSGKMQIVVKEESIDKKYLDIVNNLDQGDIIGVFGKIFRTKRGELSIDAQELTFLSKSFLPLPDKWHGLKDPEIKYRKRYLDLIMSKESRDVFITRSKIISIIREIMSKKDFIETDTPLLQPLYGGANARPFTTESFVWKRKLYLSISPELYLKRLLVGGFEKVYTICKNFRNEGVDKSHNPEFTMLEAYEAYKDYNSGMDLVEEIYETVALKLNGTTKVTYQDKEYDLKRPWKKMTMIQALKEFAGLDIDKKTDDDLKKLLSENKIVLETYKRGLAISELFEILCEEHLIGPIHIIDHPKETTPLCKLHRTDKSLIERDEPYLNSMELGNLYSELNDPELQERLMVEQKDQGRAKGENHPIDDDFLECLRYGMPPAYGVGIGIDRLVMLFTNSQNIRDVILFPLLKEESD